MITLDEAREFALSLPATSVAVKFGSEHWNVFDKSFAWHRPFRKADIKRFGENPIPSGEIIAVSTVDLGDKEAILAAKTKGFFDIEHFSNYPAFLVQLNKVSKRDAKAAILDGWLAKAPEDLAAKYMNG